MGPKEIRDGENKQNVLRLQKDTFILNEEYVKLVE